MVSSSFPPPRRFRAVLLAALLLTAGFFAVQPAVLSLRAKPHAPATLAAVTLQEAFSFQLKDLAVRHQGGNTLGVAVRYTYVEGIPDADYPDFRVLAQTCEEFLTRYPQESAFWEVVNKELTQTLLDKFPALAAVTVELHVSATSRIPYGRASTVTRRRSPAPREG